MDVGFLTDYLVAAVFGICLCVGFVIKYSIPAIPNRYIPLIMLVLGTAVNCLMNLNAIDATVVLGGMFSGLASTGAYEMFRNLIGIKEKEDDVQ